MFLCVVFVVVLISVVMALLYFIVSLWSETNVNSKTSYECGFDGSSLARMTFSHRFFLIAILFLIFDVEISLLLPVPFLKLAWLCYIAITVFVGVLLVGLIYEVKLGSLDWL